MSADAETDPRGLPAIADGDRMAGSPGGAGAPGGTGQDAGPAAADRAGRLLGRLSVLPALLAMAWLLAGLPLLLAGRFTPVLMLAVSVPLAGVLIYLGLRWLPGRWPGALPAPGPRQAHTPWWAVAGVLVVAAAFGAHQLIYHSQQIIVLRDPASYIQFAAWISQHGSLPIPQARAAFGGTHHVLQFNSPAFYQVGGAIVPQFMAGMPMALAAGFWVGGVGTAVTVAPMLGACAVLTFGGLAARLTGPRWAPLAALALALSLPEQFTSRSAYSEPLAQILFLGGLCLVIDSLEGGAGARVIAALGGLALGLTLLVRIDGASDILPVIPYGGILLLSHRRRQAVALLGGLLAGALCGAVDGLVLSRPYLVHIRSSLVPLVLVGAAVVIATALAVAVMWRRGLPQVRGKWLLNAAALLPVVAVILFTARAYLHRVSNQFIAPTATSQQLASWVQQYYMISLRWVFWYVGVPAVLLGTLGAALLARRCLQGRAPAWTLPLMAFSWIIVTVLYRPAIYPDQPWASRRLVPAVLPGLILLAVWASNWLVTWVRERGHRRVTSWALASFCAALLLVPPAVTTFGLGIRHGGPLGVRPVAHGLALKRTYAGEIVAVNRLCAAIPPDSSVVIIGKRAGHQMPQVIRGMCGNPVAVVIYPQVSSLKAALRGIAQAGRRPVVLARTPAELAPYGGTATQVMALRTRRDARTLAVPPRATKRWNPELWMTEPDL
jgi:hypothetical protein